MFVIFFFSYFLQFRTQAEIGSLVLTTRSHWCGRCDVKTQLVNGFFRWGISGINTVNCKIWLEYNYVGDDLMEIWPWAASQKPVNSTANNDIPQIFSITGHDLCLAVKAPLKCPFMYWLDTVSGLIRVHSCSKKWLPLCRYKSPKRRAFEAISCGLSWIGRSCCGCL